MKTKILSITCLLSILVVFNQCVEPEGVNNAEVVGNSGLPNDEFHGGGAQESEIGDVVGGGSSVIDEFSENGATAVAIAIADIGIKDFEKLNMTMSVLTGINPRSETSISNTYDELTSSLPASASIKTFSSTIQFSIFKLATEYCNVMLDNANYYNVVFTNVNLGQGIKNSSTSKDALVNDLVNRFWGGAAVQDASLLTSSKAQLRTLLDELLADEADTGAASRKVAKGVCAAALSTPQVTML